MNRIVVTRPFIGICGMQICAVNDVTDEEILEVCNRENPAGISNGWSEVIREVKKDDMFRTKASLPGPCDDNSERTHFFNIMLGINNGN